MEAAVIEALHVARLPFGETGNAEEELVRNDCEVVRATDSQVIAAAIARFQISSAGAIGLLGVQLDGAADGILARQGALRAPQDLDPVEVDQVKGRAEQRRVVDVVDVHADAGLQRIAGVSLANATDVHLSGGPK